MSDHQFANFQWPSFRPPLEQYKLDYGIGIVGYGGIVRAQHMPAYRLAGYRVVGAVDTRQERQDVARLDGIPNVYADHKELLSHDDVQIIDCAIFHDPAGMESRVQVLKDAAKAGKAVLMHKPMANDLETAEEMVKIAEDHGIAYAVNQNMRFDPAIYTAKQFLSPERFGKPVFIHFATSSFEGPELDFNSEGVVLGWHIHAIDSINWLGGGDPVSVYCTNKNYASLYQIEFSNGTVCDSYEYHNADSFRCETPLRIWAEKGAIRGNHRWNPGSRWERDLIEVRGYDWPKEVGWVNYCLPDELTGSEIYVKPQFDHCASIGGFIGTMGEFMQSIYEKRPALTNGRDNLKSLRIYFAGQLSAEKKRPIDPRTMKPVE